MNLKHSAAVVFALLVMPICGDTAAEEPAMCRIADSMLKQAVAIRGLSPKTNVPCIVSSRSDIEKFLQDMIATQLPPEKVEMEELVYKTVGLIPEDFDYKKGLISLYVSQIGGYYDPEKKQFVMADWIPTGVQAAVAVHELTHALQDQHYDLERMLDPKQDNGDKLMAHSALAEGDAMLVMTDYERGLKSLSPLQDEPSIDALVQQQSASALIGGDSEAIPETLKSILLFPYTSGLRFMHMALRKGEGYNGVDAVFRNPPTTTREIMHPEVYWDPHAPKSRIPSSSELQSAAKKGSQVYSDVLGEFLIEAALCAKQREKGACTAAAQGWLGDRIGVFVGADKSREVIWLTRWESPHDAHEFAEAYRVMVHSQSGASSTQDGEPIRISATKTLKIMRKETEVTLLFAM